jgi:hypothetical protein
MGYKFNPFTGTLDTVDSPNGVFEELDVNGDIVLDDGGTYTTTVQCVTPTANRTISFPDATGTVGLVAGSSGQLLYNASGANAGASTLTYDGSILTSSGRFINSYNATASSPAKAFTGTWFTGGTSTTTKPQVLIEPTGATSTAWSTSGTGFGVNAASGFAGNLLDLQVNGTSRAILTNAGRLDIVGTGNPLLTIRGSDAGYSGQLTIQSAGGGTSLINGTGGNNALAFLTGGGERARIDSSGDVLINTTASPIAFFDGKLRAASSTTVTSFRCTGVSGAILQSLWHEATSGDNQFVSFGTETTRLTRGSISYNRAGGLVAYNTTSDYRAKTILGDIDNSGEAIDALKVYRGVMNGATVERPMLVAHEAQEVAPYCVTGEKDAVDDDGNPIYQQMDHQALVPLLIAEIQQLRNRVAALEGA